MYFDVEGVLTAALNFFDIIEWLASGKWIEAKQTFETLYI